MNFRLPAPAYAVASAVVRVCVFLTVVSAFTAVSDWLFPQLEGLASENVLKLAAWAGFAASLWVAWLAARHVGGLLVREREYQKPSTERQ